MVVFGLVEHASRVSSAEAAACLGWEECGKGCMAGIRVPVEGGEDNLVVHSSLPVAQGSQFLGGKYCMHCKACWAREVVGSSYRQVPVEEPLAYLHQQKERLRQALVWYLLWTH